MNAVDTNILIYVHDRRNVRKQVLSRVDAALAGLEETARGTENLCRESWIALKRTRQSARSAIAFVTFGVSTRKRQPSD
jgi:predicted nucleic acid-binding protein